MLSSQNTFAAEVSTIERAPSSTLHHVLINEGTLHGYEKGRSVCFLSPAGAKLVCSKIVQASEFYSLVAVSSKAVLSIKPGMLVRPQDFTAKKPGAAELRAPPPPAAPAAPSSRLRIAAFALQNLVNETSYNRVGFRRIGAAGRDSHWGHRASEAKANGYAVFASYQVTAAAQLNLGVRALGPMSEDLNDRYDGTSSDSVQSRTEFTSNGMSATYGYKKMYMSWVALEYSTGIDINATTIGFKSFRSGSKNQLLGRATSRKTFLGILLDSQLVFPYKWAGVILGVTATVPVAVIGKSYDEEVDDIAEAPASKTIQGDLGHEKAPFGLSARFGLSLSL